MLYDVLLQVNRNPPGPGGGDVLAVGLNLISMGLLLALLIVFLGTYMRTKAPFTLGLVIFVGALLLGNLARAGRIFRLNSPGLTVIPEFLEIVALAVLLYLATR